MRQILIDAMELKKILPKFILEEAEAYIDETEEIEAIPIEWINKWVVTTNMGAGRTIDRLLEDWWKENALDKQIEQWEFDDDMDWQTIQREQENAEEDRT